MKLKVTSPASSFQKQGQDGDDGERPCYIQAGGSTSVLVRDGCSDSIHREPAAEALVGRGYASRTKVRTLYSTYPFLPQLAGQQGSRWSPRPNLRRAATPTRPSTGMPSCVSVLRTGTEVSQACEYGVRTLPFTGNPEHGSWGVGLERPGWGSAEANPHPTPPDLTLALDAAEPGLHTREWLLANPDRAVA